MHSNSKFQHNKDTTHGQETEHEGINKSHIDHDNSRKNIVNETTVISHNTASKAQVKPQKLDPKAQTSQMAKSRTQTNSNSKPVKGSKSMAMHDDDGKTDFASGRDSGIFNVASSPDKEKR
jgi:hypothetical protein